MRRHAFVVSFGAAVLLSVVIGASLFLRRAHHHGQRSNCLDNLSVLGAAYMRGVAGGDAPEPGGAIFLVELLRRDPSMSSDRLWRILSCPADAHLSDLASRDRLARSRVATEVRRACSYVVRDFQRYPITPDEPGGQAVAADAEDRHFGVNVLFADGSVRFIPRSDPDHPIVVGAQSPDPELQKLAIVVED